MQEFGPRVRRAPQPAQLGFALEEVRQLAKQQFHELLRRHRRAIGMPKRRCHHALNVALLAVGQFHLRLFLADARALVALRARLLRTLAWTLSAHRTGLRFWLLAHTGIAAALRAWFRFHRLAIPFPVLEMVMRLHEIINREIIFAVKQPRAAPDDLLRSEEHT